MKHSTSRVFSVGSLFAGLALAVLGSWGCSHNGEQPEPIGGGPMDNVTGEFDAWDHNDDGMLDQDEFAAGLEDKGFFDDADQNSDGNLSEEEFTVATENAGLTDVEFDMIDADEDGMVDSDEFQDGMFDAFDENDSGFIESDEYEPGMV